MGDTASRWSQTESPRVGTSGEVIKDPHVLLYAELTAPFANTKKKWAVTGRGSYPRSLWVSPNCYPTAPKERYKNRRATPMSNRPCIPTPPRPIPTEFDIEEFACAYLSGPRTEYGRFNGDLEIEHYAPSTRPYSGSHRQGISEATPNASSYADHIQTALKSTFPLAEQAPIPSDLINALNSNRGKSGWR